MSDEYAYNKGIEENFAYHHISQYYSDYITSTHYNRAGTSVKYSNTTEPGDTHIMKYTDGKTKAIMSVQVKYPVNTIYKGGRVRIDKLTKIKKSSHRNSLPTRLGCLRNRGTTTNA